MPALVDSEFSKSWKGAWQLPTYGSRACVSPRPPELSLGWEVRPVAGVFTPQRHRKESEAPS